jgi:ESCRT-II complex subunit VPS36
VELSSFASAEMSAGAVQDKSKLHVQRLLLAIGDGVRVEFLSPGLARRDKERVMSNIASACAKRLWAQPKVPRPIEKQRQLIKQSGLTALQQVGRHGAMSVQRFAADERGKEIKTGFSSLDALYASADKLVETSRRFKSLTVCASDTDGSADNDMLNMMADLGIQSPVTKDASGNNRNLYRVELARQLSDYLRDPVIQMGGIMTLTDAYCLVNRARAIVELVSPDDFVAATNMFTSPRIASKLTVFTLDSGVRALRVDMSRESNGGAALAALAHETSSISALQLMRERNVTVQVALRMLESAEQSGHLVRDETTDGIRFYPNVFFTF